MRYSILALALAASATSVHAGPFAPAAGQSGSTAVDKGSADIVQWATGYQDYVPGSNVDASWKIPGNALGAAQGTSTDIVALGDQGRITLSFGGTIRNGDGWDFAVFENSFSDTFLELAFVEVSSNGSDFFRFPTTSFTPAPINAFGSVDPTNIDGLAGKYRQGFGTPFDLAALSGIAGLDVDGVIAVRLVDVKGDGSEFDNFPAAFGGPHPIYDPFQTVISGGFDLDAVGVRHFAAAVPEPGPVALFAAGLGLVAFRLRRRASV